MALGLALFYYYLFYVLRNIRASNPSGNTGEAARRGTSAVAPRWSPPSQRAWLTLEPRSPLLFFRIYRSTRSRRRHQIGGYHFSSYALPKRRQLACCRLSASRTRQRCRWDW